MEADIAFIFVYAMRAVRGFFVDRGSYLPVFERALDVSPRLPHSDPAKVAQAGRAAGS